MDVDDEPSVINADDDGQAPGADEDEIIGEIDVVMSQDLANHLYVVQYPLRPPWRPYDPNHLKEIRFKAQRQVLEMDYAVPDAELFGARTATRIITDGEAISTPQEMTQHTVKSTVVPLKTNYAVGLYRDRALYLTPIKGIFQMRPSFKYIDDSHEKVRARKEESARLEANTQPQAPAAEEEKLVTVSTQHKVSDKSLQRERKSHAWLVQQELQDEALKMDFVYRDDPLATSTFERLTRSANADVILDVTRTEYMELITPESQTEADPVAAAMAAWDRTGGAGLSKHIIQHLPVEKKVEATLLNTKIIRFITLISDFPNVDHESILKALDLKCFLIHGCWVIKSDLLYRGRVKALRDYALHLFSKSPDASLAREELDSMVHLPPKLLKDFLSEIADVGPDKRWHLKHAPDDDFIATHSHIQARHEAYLQENDGARFIRELTVARDDNRVDIPQGSAPRQPQQQQKSGKAYMPPVRTDDAPGPTIPIDEASSNLLQQAIRKLLAENGVLNIKALFGEIKKQQIKGAFAAFQGDIFDDLVRQEALKISYQVQNVYCVKVSGEPSPVDELRLCAIELFRQAERVKKQDFDRAAMVKGISTVNKRVYERVMKEFATYGQEGFVWKLNSGDIPLRENKQVVFASAAKDILDGVDSL